MQYRPSSISIGAMSLLMTALCAPNVSAKETDCIIGERYKDANTMRKYKINPEYSAPIGPERGVINAVIHAADLWNEQSNTSHFVYAGQTNLRTETYPEFKTTPKCEEIDFSLIQFEPARVTGLLGVATPICGGRLFRITLFVNAENPPNIPTFGGGFRGSDLISTALHELGHTLNLGGLNVPELYEVDREVSSVMQGGTVSEPRRNIEHYDSICTQRASGQRTLSLYKNHVGQRGTLYPELYREDGIKYSAGYHAQDGVWNPSFSVVTDTGNWWDNRPEVIEIMSEAATYTSSIDEAVLREQGGTGKYTSQASVFSTVFGFDTQTWQFGGAWKEHATILMQDKLRASDHFTLPAIVAYCTHTEPGHCDPFPLTAPSGLAVGWNPASERSVFAWVADNRNNYDPETRRLWPESTTGWVYVSSGIYGAERGRIALNTPVPLKYHFDNEFGHRRVRSNSKPGVVCSHDTCILAWSSTGYYDLNDFGQVKVVRFDPDMPVTVPVASRGVAGPWNVEASLEGERIEARTVSNIAAWYNAESGSFFIALRSTEPMQPLRVFTSRDGIRWQLDTSLPPTYSALGPSAASHWTGSNMLLHGR